MAGVVSRESYFETGLEVLSDLGYGGLKLAEVCNPSSADRTVVSNSTILASIREARSDLAMRSLS